MLHSLFNSRLSPHGMCLLWDPTLLWLHATADLLIGIAYYVIPAGLAWLMIRRRDLLYSWMFGLFAVFILACGTTHFLDVWILWHPDYGIQGLLKAFTALVSVVTAGLVWAVIPRLLTIPTPAQFRRVSSLLSEETRRHGDTVVQLRQSEQNFRLLLENLRDCAVCMLDPSGTVTSWNQGAQNITGYRTDEIIGSHFSRFYVAQDREGGKPMRALRHAAADGSYHEAGLRVRRDGSTFMADVSIHSIRDADGELIGFSKITRDITKRHRAEMELEQTRAALAQSQKMQAVGQLTGGIAHDFNNMLTAVLGGVELLETGAEPLTPRVLRVVRMIRRAADHGAQLTTRLLAFSRKQALAPSVTDINELVSDMTEILKRTLGTAITIDIKLSQDVSVSFLDANELEAALLNLAVNARDAMPQGGTLTIETSHINLTEDYVRRHVDATVGAYICLTVRDTGCGMPPDVLEHAFEPFYTTKDAAKGTGLGLSQVYGFVRQSGGRVEIDSRVNEGTAVRLYLPRLAPDRAATSMGGENSESLPRGTETILIVEDNEDVRNYSATAARYLGYTVIEAADATEARAKLEENPDIRLMITDVGLPGTNGRDLGEMVQASHAGLKVAYTSGYARPALAELGLLERGVRLLPKPFRIETFARLVRAALDEG